MPEAALLFAAGFGRRMAPLTDSRPKPLVDVAGRPLIEHALRLLREAKLLKLVANTHYRAEMLSPVLARLGVAESFEPSILDTGGGLKNALPLLSASTVFTLNTDAVWTGPNPAEALRRHWRPESMDALLAVVPRNRATGHTGGGDFDLDEEGRLIPGRSHVYTGLQIIRTEPFADEPDSAFPMHRIWRPMLDAGRMYGLIHEGGWCDVGRPDCIPLAEALLERQGV